MKIDVIQIKAYDYTLRSLLSWLEAETGFEFTITSPNRPGDKGVHGTNPLRGMDLRCRRLLVGQAIAELVNDNWLYDPTRPTKHCAFLHGKGSNLHLHIQVHPNTVRVYP